MSRKVRLGIIGMGMIGTAHAKAFKNVPDVEVAAICDSHADVLKAKGEEFEVERLFADYRKMLNEPDLDAVIVGTPNFTHCKTTVDAFRAGKHVLCEKPMALNAREGRKMVAAAKKARKVLQMGMVWRQRAESLVAKDYIEKGYLGRIYHMHLVLRRRRGIPGLGGWFTTRALAGGGVLIDIGVHLIDLLMWLSNNWKPTRVSAALYAEFGRHMKDYVFTSMWAGPPKYDGTFDVDDYAAGIVRFPKDVTLSFELSWAANCEPESFVELLGNKGGIRLDESNGFTLFTEHNGRIADIRPQYAEVAHFDEQCRHFIRAIRGRGKPPATGEQGVAVMEVLDAIHKSAELGKEVAIPQRTRTP